MKPVLPRYSALPTCPSRGVGVRPHRLADRQTRWSWLGRWVCVFALLAWAWAGEAKSYSSGGRSFSRSSSSSRSFGSGSSGGRSYSSSGSRSYSSGKTFSFGSGRSYSSGSSPGASPSSGGSGRSYSSSGWRSFLSPASKPSAPRSDPSSGSKFSFDTGAAQAQKQAASRRQFQRWRSAAEVPTGGSTRSEVALPRPSYTYSSPYRRPMFNLPPQTYRTRPIRIEHVFRPYYSRPLVVYHDPFSSFFWWWLLDQSIENQAYWAYNHRYDMDPARYQSLVASNTALQQRVSQLEAQQVAVNPSYVPPGLDRDLMYTDQYVRHASNPHPALAGRFIFWLIMIPTTVGIIWFLGWLIFVKRWYASA